MSYPGNTSLPPDVQERIIQTFAQSLDLASSGKLQEARLGCDFVLRLDSQFAPARKLQERLREASGPVEVADLRPGAKQEDSFADLDDLPDLPDLEPLDEQTLEGSLATRLQSLLRKRDFRGVVALAGEHQAQVVADPDLRRIAMQASERLEAEPLVRGMLDAAITALASGDRERAAGALEEARQLDPDHPEIAALEARLDDGSEPDLDDAELPDLQLGSFEADQLGGPSFDLATPSRTASSGDPRIDELLDEGQLAFDRGDHQDAIDAWSRIFLIDIDHAEANRRIEEARRRKAEAERETEAIFHEAQGRVDAGDLDGARELLTRLLELQPQHYAGSQLLESLADGGPAKFDAPTPGVRPVGGGESAREVLQEEILVPPDPGQEPGSSTRGAVALPKPSRAGAGRGRVGLVAAGLVVLALAGGVGWWLTQSRDEVFPNTVEPTPTELSAVERAQSLYESGKPANAIALLKRVPPNDPAYEESQRLLVQWEGEITPAPAEEPDPSEAARIEGLLAEARTAFADGHMMLAARRYSELDDTITLAEEDLRQQELANASVTALAPLIRALREGEYEIALPELWRLREANPGGRDATALLIVGYHNLGLRELQRGGIAKAREMFTEAAQLDPDDQDLARLVTFARTYEGRGDDLLSRIFIKYAVPRNP